MYSKELIKNVYKYDKEDQDNFFEDKKINYFDVFDTTKFNIFGSAVKDKKILFRFTLQDIEKIGSASDAVSYLATNSSGLQVRFKTDSRRIFLRVLQNGVFDMKNMTFMGQCGFDLYYKEEDSDEFRFMNSGFPNYIDTKKYITILGGFKDSKIREYIINFPLYSTTTQLEIGLEENSVVYPTEFKNKGRIVTYGTSILQGGCVSRPGLSVTNMLSRYLDQEVLNFGFSGAGLLENEIGEVIANISKDIKILIIDAEANAGCDTWMYDRLEGFLNKFYELYPGLKVIIMNKTKMTIDKYIARNKRIKLFNDKFLKNIVKKYRKKGFKIMFFNNYNIFKLPYLNEDEFTVDGVHPNDIGMYLLFKNYLKAIRKVEKI